MPSSASQVLSATAAVKESRGCRILVVDLDHTLVATDCLFESVLKLIFRAFGGVPVLARRLAEGRAAIKAELAKLAPLDASLLPYDSQVLNYIEAHRGQGGEVHLVTAFDQSLADSVALHLNLFDSAIGSDETRDLKGEAKAKYLRGRFGDFIYVGGSHGDLKVWKEASGVVVVADNPTLISAAQALNKGHIEVLPRRRPGLRDWFDALRIHQWSKNAVLFTALFLSHQLLEPVQVLKCVAAFVLFGMVASATYLINDLADLEDDRAHPTKRMRPMASGCIPIGLASSAAASLLIFALLAAAVVSTPLLLALCLYLLVTFAYTFYFKRRSLVDLLTIGVLFAIRVGAGAVVLNQPLSIWLVAFTVTLFTSLAAAKRHAELIRAGRSGRIIAGRDYQVEDAPITLALGLATASICTMLMLLYMQFEAMQTGLYREPSWLFLIPLVLASWLLRIWSRAHRGELHDDPVVFALRDWGSRLHAVILGLLWLGAVLAG